MIARKGAAMATLKLLHTADLHLDAPHHALGGRGADLRRRVREAFERVVDEALTREVALVIIAGDLFDATSPEARTIDFAVGQLRRLTDASPPVDVVLLPGTHDCWADGGLWASPLLRDLPDRVHLLAGPDPATTVLPDADAAIHGAPHLCARSGQRPLRSLRADDERAINIGVAHGSLDRGDVADDSLFTAEEIAATGMDYLALGHWHSHADHSSGDVTAINPGSPEVPGFCERGRGVAVEVTLGEEHTRVERVEVGTLHGRTLELEAGDLRGTEDLVARVAERGDPELLLDVRVTGLSPPEALIDVEDARERLADAFFAVRVTDRSHPAVDDIDDALLRETLALGRFVELARERIKAADDERERRVAERALRIGVSMLRGGGGR